MPQNNKFMHLKCLQICICFSRCSVNKDIQILSYRDVDIQDACTQLTSHRYNKQEVQLSCISATKTFRIIITNLVCNAFINFAHIQWYCAIQNTESIGQLILDCHCILTQLKCICLHVKNFDKPNGFRNTTAVKICLINPFSFHFHLSKFSIKSFR